jgi:hypothetical protein
MIMKSSIFWVVTSCCSLKVNRRFGGKFRPHLQGRKKAKENLLSTCFYASFLSFHPENGGDIFLYIYFISSLTFQNFIMYVRDLLCLVKV